MPFFCSEKQAWKQSSPSLDCLLQLLCSNSSETVSYRVEVNCKRIWQIREDGNSMKQFSPKESITQNILSPLYYTLLTHQRHTLKAATNSSDFSNQSLSLLPNINCSLLFVTSEKPYLQACLCQFVYAFWNLFLSLRNRMTTLGNIFCFFMK